MLALALLQKYKEVCIQAQDSLEDCRLPEVWEVVCILELEVDTLAYWEDYKFDEPEAGIRLLGTLEVGNPS